MIDNRSWAMRYRIRVLNHGVLHSWSETGYTRLDFLAWGTLDLLKLLLLDSNFIVVARSIRS